MANARTAFDALVTALQAEPDVRDATLNGKRALAFEGEPFLLLHRDAVAFRLHGRPLLRARAIEGSIDFDPYNPEEGTMSRPGWVRIPATAFQSWERLARESLTCAREARWKNVSWDAPTAVATPDVEGMQARLADTSQRAQRCLSSGFSFALEPLPG